MAIEFSSRLPINKSDETRKEHEMNFVVFGQFASIQWNLATAKISKELISFYSFSCPGRDVNKKCLHFSGSNWGKKKLFFSDDFEIYCSAMYFEGRGSIFCFFDSYIFFQIQTNFTILN